MKKNLCIFLTAVIALSVSENCKAAPKSKSAFAKQPASLLVTGKRGRKKTEQSTAAKAVKELHPEHIRALEVLACLKSQDIYYCQECEINYNTKYDLAEHIAEHAACPLCKNEFLGDNMKGHVDHYLRERRINLFLATDYIKSYESLENI